MSLAEVELDDDVVELWVWIGPTRPVWPFWEERRRRTWRLDGMGIISALRNRTYGEGENIARQPF